jgi:hypothetical protein
VDDVIEYYSYNPTKAAEVIAEEMANLGATLVDDKWHYNGEPVVLNQVIRNDLAPYPALGDYFADQLESVGKFTVERLYRAAPRFGLLPSSWEMSPREYGTSTVVDGGCPQCSGRRYTAGPSSIRT